MFSSTFLHLGSYLHSVLYRPCTTGIFLKLFMIDMAVGWTRMRSSRTMSIMQRSVSHLLEPFLFSTIFERIPPSSYTSGPKRDASQIRQRDCKFILIRHFLALCHLFKLFPSLAVILFPFPPIYRPFSYFCFFAYDKAPFILNPETLLSILNENSLIFSIGLLRTLRWSC